MKLNGRTALVTGANRGLGAALTDGLLARGARVYAAVRDPDRIGRDDVTPVRVDVTDPASIDAAAAATGDVDLLVNNAGVLTRTSLLTGSLPDIEREFQVNFYGPLRMVRAFAPQLARAPGGGAVLDILSVLSWVSLSGQGAYCASKSAAWSMTNALRQELQPDDITVTAVHVGLIDTDMVSGTSGPRTSPAEVAHAALVGVEDGSEEVVVDAWTRRVQAELAHGVKALYPVRIG